jgi:hypothetical protein
LVLNYSDFLGSKVFQAEVLTFVRTVDTAPGTKCAQGGVMPPEAKLGGLTGGRKSGRTAL